MSPGKGASEQMEGPHAQHVQGVGGQGAVPETGLPSMSTPQLPPRGTVLVNRRIRLSKQPLEAFCDDRLGQFVPFSTSQQLSVWLSLHLVTPSPR